MHVYDSFYSIKQQNQQQSINTQH